MRKIICLFILLMLVTPALGVDPAEIDDPKMVSRIEGHFIENSSISLSGTGQADYVNVSLYLVPQDYRSVKFSSLKTDPNADLIDDHYLSYYWTKPEAGNLEFKAEADFVSEFKMQEVREEVSFPYDLSSLDPDVKKYLVSSEIVDFDNVLVRKKANEIALGEKDAYVVAFKISEWINSELTYDTKYNTGDLKASEILVRGEGSCGEYATLFIAMMRSLGIPARYVSGSTYTNIWRGFGPHGWAEVYFPNVGWVVFDPTYEEYGWSDPTHIPLQIGSGPDEPSIKYYWTVGEVESNPLDRTVLLDSYEEELPTYISSNVRMQYNHTTLRSSNVLWFDLKNEEDFYVVTEVQVLVAPGVDGDNVKQVLLKPKEEKSVGFVITIPEDLDEKYVYTYPIEANVVFSQAHKTEFTVDKTAKQTLSKTIAEKLVSGEEVEEEPDIVLAAKTEVKVEYKSPAYVGEDYSVDILLSNSGNKPDDVTVCVGKRCKDVFVGINANEVVNFDFNDEKKGYRNLSVSLKSEVLDQTGNIRIDVIEKGAFQNFIDWIKSFFGY